MPDQKERVCALREGARLKPTRGELNHNPGNLDRTRDRWLGMSARQTDSRFVQFDNAHDGIRALARVLLNYSKKYRLNTVHGIVSRWAPPTENNTEAYVNSVALALGTLPHAIVDVADPNVLHPLVRAIIRHENGRVSYSDDEIHEAVIAALPAKVAA